MQATRVLGIVVGSIVAVVAVTLVCIGLFVDPNRYKARIYAAVKNATGRQLTLPGDIKLSVFPWIALQLGPASLGNPPGFGPRPFISVQHAKFRVKLLPLLSKRLEIGRVELDGLDARLEKKADGRSNWEGFGHSGKQPPAATDGGSGGQVFAGIAGIQITNARVSYNEFVFENLNVETGSFASKALVPVTIQFEANRGISAEHAQVDATFDFSSDLGAKRYSLAAVTLRGTVARAAEPRPLRWNLSSASVAFDFEAQSLSVPAFALELAGAQLTGSLAGSHVIDEPILAAKLALAPLVVREFLPRVGATVPRTRDQKALSLVSASTALTYRNGGVALEDLSLTVDDTQLKGQVSIPDPQTQAIRFALVVDHIDVDRYLAPQGEPVAASAPGFEAHPRAASAKPWEANGSLTVGSIHLAALDLTAVSVTLAASGGVMHLFPLKAQVDGGHYSGDITVDGRESVPRLTMDEHLIGIDVAKLVRTGSKTLHASGHGNVSIKASAQGAAADGVLKTLNGHFEALVTGGALEGVDIGFQLGRAEAAIRRQDGFNAPDTQRTPFDALKVSAEISNGVAETKDLTIASSILKVTGQGSMDLPTQAIDLSLLADTLKTVGSTPIQIPIKIMGTPGALTLRPDLEALAKGQLRQKLQDAVQDKLKGFFNR